jgi:gamma-glutamyltranspeptidase/glutathione hydrolase
MDDFSAKAESQYVWTVNEANSIPRMLSSMTPTIVEKNGKLL